MTSPLQIVHTRIRLSIRVQPGASANAVAGIGHDAAGKSFVKIRVTQAPEGGKANRAVTRLLAKAWHMPASAITVVAGHKDRRKVLEISGDDDAAATIRAWLDEITA